MSMVSDYTKAPVEILIDLINHDNGTQLIAADLEFSAPSPSTGIRNSIITVQGALGAPVTGEATLTYNRILLSEVVGGGDVSFVLSPSATTTRDLIPQLNARYGVNLTGADLINAPLASSGGDSTLVLQAHPDSLVFLGQVQLEVFRHVTLAETVVVPFLTGFTAAAATPEVTAVDKLLVLLNAQEPLAQGQFSNSTITISNPVVSIGVGYDTRVTLTGVADALFEGTTTVYYQRVNLATLLAGLEFSFESPVTDQVLVDAINSLLGTFLRLSDLDAVVIPAMTTGVKTPITLTAQAGSLGFRSQGTVNVVTGLPASADALHTYVNVTYPGYFNIWDTAPHDVFVPPTFPAPVSTVAPVASGGTAIGSTLACTSGTWTGSGITYSYQWKADGAVIAAAITNGYIVVAGDSGKSITCTVTATNAGGAASRTSNALVIALPAAVNTVAPAVTGATSVGSILSCDTGTWTGSGLAYTYQWKANGVNIAGETASTYQTVTADGGATITCVVTATNSGGAVAQASNAVVVDAAATNVAMVAVQDDTVNAGALRSTDGGVTWATESMTDASQWAAIGYGAGQFVALAYGVSGVSVDYVSTSPTGLVWTGHPGVAGAWKDVAYSASLGWCAVGDDGRIATSADGVTWTQRFLDANIYFFGVAWSGTNFVAMGYTHAFAATCYTSPDGVAWTSRATVNGAAWNAVRSDGAGKCVAVANGGVIASSLNHGVNWTQRVSNCSSPLGAVVWTGSTFVVGGQYEIATSPDAVTWTNRANGDPIAVPADCLGWSGVDVVALSFDSIFTSADQGATWTQQALTPNLYWRKVASAL